MSSSNNNTLPKLSARLAALVRLIPEGARVADVGCDHGKVSVAALLSGRASFCVAVDISEKCLDKARVLAEKYGVSGRMRFVLGDGLKDVFASEVSTVIIAGMGGHNIADIIAAAPERYKNYILMPHKNKSVAENALRAENLQYLDIKIKDGNRIYDIIYTIEE